MFKDLMHYLRVAENEPDGMALHQIYHSLPQDHEVGYDHKTNMFYSYIAEHGPKPHAMSAKTPHQTQTNIQQPNT